MDGIFSGKILHIDFGDCFEASMNREKFPEKVCFFLSQLSICFSGTHRLPEVEESFGAFGSGSNTGH